MNISHDVYANLTTAERIRAAISALAREDLEELRRLKETCPMKVLKITDPGYSEKMPLIISVLLTMECDLRGCTLDFLISKQKNLNVDAIEEILTRMATRHAGLRLFANAEGIDFAELEACAPSRHPAVACLLKHISGGGDEKEAEEIAACLREIVDQGAC